MQCCQVDNLEVFQGSRAQEVPPTQDWCRKPMQKNPNTHPNHAAERDARTVEQCSQAQQMNIVLSYAADEWLSPTGHKALTRGVMCLCVCVCFVTVRGDKGDTKSGTFQCKRVIFSHTCICEAAQTNTCLPTHTNTNRPLSFLCFNAAASVEISPPVT